MSATDQQELERALEPIRAERRRGAILCDLDGTLAPIVERPQEAAVPEAAREVLRALAARYRLCGVVTGRRAAQAKQMVGLEELAYAGNHGFELLRPGEAEPSLAQGLRGHERDAAEFVAAHAPETLAEAGIHLEDKGPIVALHWRGAADEDRAESLAAELASAAKADGLLAHRGRKVLEIRPRVAIDKGAAVRSLLVADEFAAALYAGDDRTDLDAFAALRGLERDGALDATCCVAVASAEGPPELAPQADLVVEGTDGVLWALELLAR